MSYAMREAMLCVSLHIDKRSFERTDRPSVPVSARKTGNMYLLSRGESGGGSAPLEWLTPQRMVFCSCAIAISHAALLATWAWVGRGFTLPEAGRPGIDFSIFWAASHLFLSSRPLQVYDHQAFLKAQLMLFGGFADGYSLPWVYPPAFLLLVAPLSLIAFPAAYAVFIVACGLLYVTATLSVSRLDKSIGAQTLAAIIIATSPCVFVTAIVGQNSLLTAALAALGVGWMKKHPVRAGICIGLLALKPQLAIVFPFVLCAARAWKVLAISAFSALIVTALGIAFCGTQSFHSFLVNAGVLRGVLLEHGQHFWFASPTPFSALRLAGVPVVAAYALHGLVAIVAIWVACHVWKSSSDERLRTSIVVVSTLIVSPYVWHYELVWHGIALACVASCGLNGKWLRGEQTVLAVGWLLPIYEHFNRVMLLPQVGPAVLLMTMLIILRRAQMPGGAKA
jgi:alpha-1,2-mannosyltransferase